MSRRSFLAMTAASADTMKAGPARKQVPVGVLVYAVIEDWSKDPDATAVALARMGFTGLEITNYMPQWDAAKCKAFRKVMDASQLKCYATHTEPGYFVPSDDMKRMIEM